MAPALKPGFVEAAGRTASNIELPWRVLSLLNVFRLLLPMLLLLVFFFNAPTNSVGAHQPGMFIGIAVAYFAFALVCIQTIQSRSPSAEWQAMVQLVVDAIAMSLLIHASGGVSSGLGTLLVLPTGATATILARRYALLGTSLVTLALLVETTISFLQGASSRADFLITGLTGASLFAITLLAIPFAARLRESEALAQQREIDIANLNELNEFIVQHLRESILVVDETDNVRLINETAARLLKGGAVPGGATLASISPRLAYLIEAWRRQASDRRDTVGEVVGADGGTIIRPHFVALSDSGSGPVLVFLEDTSLIAERAQQSKLAALGRLSASIAHEIRNPVGAMSHAGQLLRESPTLTADDRHLTDIIEKNGVRVSHIIENVLQLSRRDTTKQERFNVSEWLSAFVTEYEQTMQMEPARSVSMRTPHPACSRYSSIRRTCTRCSGTCATTRSGTAIAAIQRSASTSAPDAYRQPAARFSRSRTAATASIPPRPNASSSRSSRPARAAPGSASSSRANCARPTARCSSTSRDPPVVAFSASFSPIHAAGKDDDRSQQRQAPRAGRGRRAGHP